MRLDFYTNGQGFVVVGKLPTVCGLVNVYRSLTAIAKPCVKIIVFTKFKSEYHSCSMHATHCDKWRTRDTNKGCESFSQKAFRKRKKLNPPKS
ncbi:hypothetical protein CDAR_271271 [Caerostris darwini]|uniref:Uncharacterized protein n=1 Tax=Caerostris darwini TaxID=1538125 RepID=A0AAV4TFU7_9ARAC|nr:hypothetical protein CDAR_271271 [Caerostris darwini]